MQLRKFALICIVASAGFAYAEDNNDVLAANGYCTKNSCRYANQNNNNSNNNSPKQMTEEDLMNQLNPEMQQVYQSLTPQGKELALKLASQNVYQDKNKAVKDAADRMKRNLHNP